MLVLKKERNFISSVKYNLKGTEATNKNDTVITFGFFPLALRSCYLRVFPRVNSTWPRADTCYVYQEKFDFFFLTSYDFLDWNLGLCLLYPR